ncbi:uncharacterized protein LOC142236791 [Haematobia irritans]|uniref:uncharacterized protein LOC142236791 n=1 Tax=Haematobia irritans TaxID=7368 RepID=UPI003F50D484
MTQSILCRLCVNQCQEYETLYDENGFGTEFYEIVFKYLHPKILNLEQWRHLTGVCEKCSRHIWDFHRFEKIIAKAQIKLSEECDKIETPIVKREMGQLDLPKADEFTDHMEGSFVSLSEMAALEADGETPLNALEVQTAVRSNYQNDANNIPSESQVSENDEIFKSGPAIKLEKEFELVAVQEGYTFDADEELPTTSNFDSDIPNFGEDSSAIWLSDDSDEDLNEDFMYKSDDDAEALTGSDGRKSKETRQERERELDVLLAKFMPIIKCDLCAETYTTWPSLQEHFRDSHPLEPCYIPCCGRRLKEHWTIKEHMRYHNDPNTFKCKLCGKLSTTRCALKRHMDAQHPGVNKLKFDCKICGKAFTTESGLKYHCTTVHGDFCQPLRRTQPDGSSLYVCKDCGKKFNKADTARQHIWYHHRSMDRYKCNICGNGYGHPRQYREHMASHSKKPLYACAYCPMKFTFLNSLQGHRKAKHPYKKDLNSYIELEDGSRH